MLGPRRFTFLNEEHDLGGRGWDDASISKLWRYNLHYFDHLNGTGAGVSRDMQADLLLDWVRQNRAAQGTGWEPYPTSLRIVNWIKWALAGNALPGECVESLALQTRWLLRRLERHILGNHLFANAKALLFAGYFFDGPEAEHWRRAGASIMEKEIREQILADGGHFERSPMYQALLVEDVLDLLNLQAAYDLNASTSPFGLVHQTVNPMWRFLRALTHPDGEIAFFNDAAFGVAPGLRALEDYATRLDLTLPHEPNKRLTHLAESGYIRIEHDGAVALLDVAPVGGDYLCAHAHADTLSFELSLSHQRVVVNSGTSRYGVDEERLRQRGTAAHSTVVINGENSSEVWGGFRVARRAHPVDLEVDPENLMVRCAHTGYQRLPGRPTHIRTWKFGSASMTVLDEITGAPISGQARFHLHPDLQVTETDGGVVILALKDHRPVRVSCAGGRLQREAGTWHPRFGVSLPNQCLAIQFEAPSVQTRFEWSS
jgi:uncharacterized heparinase superfamily protein